MSDKEYLTPSELQIEARAKAATPGPWETCEEEAWTAIRTLTGHWVADSSRAYKTTADFIAHARADIPALLETLRAERAKIEWLQELEIKAIDRATHFEDKFTAERAKRAELEEELRRIKEAADMLNADAKKRFAKLYDPHTPGPDGPQGGC